MEFEEWEPYYLQIVEEFGYSREEDERVAAILDKLLSGQTLEPRHMERMIAGREVTVAGNAPSLPNELDGTRGLLITADEATSVALEAGIYPDILVTDLDGRVEDQLLANDRGAVAVIHGHGDNAAAVRKWAPRFMGSVIATTQSRPSGGLHNFGGFTDGDRAVFLAQHFGASRIYLIGFDFDRPSPKDEDAATKKKKLAWAKRLIALVDTVQMR